METGWKLVLRWQAIPLFLVRDGIMEFEDVALLAFQFGFLELDGGARVQVAETRQQIGQVVTPQQPGAHRLDVILHAVEDGTGENGRAACRARGWTRGE